jgi:ATP-binding protein involved in chromosome partitioning
MSTHICSACGHEEPIFGEGGGARMAKDHDVPLLGAIPLDLSVREETDGGRPTVVSQPDGEIAQRYMDIARRMSARLSLFARDYSRLFPKISIEDN